MAVEYDLVVVGDTAAAATAAITAAQVHARVAWVAPTRSIDPLLLLREGARGFREHLPHAANPKAWRHWTTVLQSTLANDPSATAQINGVNTIESPAVFVPGKTVSLRGEHFLWRSRTYLLAMMPPEKRPPIPGIDHPQVWSIAHLWDALRHPDESWPSALAILGNGPQAVELSQSLQSLSIPTTLLTNGQPFLPYEDHEAVAWVQAYLEGSEVLIDDRGLLNVSSTAKTDSLSLDVGEQQYHVTALVLALEPSGGIPESLQSLQLRQTSRGIAVDAALQTSIPSIYACGSLLGGYALPSLAAHEAKRAVHNALFEQYLPVQYHQVPYVIFSDPPLARVGLTEHQARRHDPQAIVLRQNDTSCEPILFQPTPTTFYKVLVQRDGTVLGVHLIGAAAAELIHLWAMIIQQGIPLSVLDVGGFASLSFATVVQQVVAQWQQQSSHHSHRDRNERWFYRRRQRIQ
jgi:pyruvate/2-oxoglutarate dehydrogenase complex dihydrolipoamide dehydrogenase (E3) component